MNDLYDTSKSIRIPQWLVDFNKLIQSRFVPHPIVYKNWPKHHRILFNFWWSVGMPTLLILGVWGKKKLPASTANTPGNVTNVDEGNVNECNSRP